MCEPTRVTVTDFDIPFNSMVRLMVKWAIAAIPALFIVAFIAIGCGLAVGMLGGGIIQLIKRASAPTIEQTSAVKTDGEKHLPGPATTDGPPVTSSRELQDEIETTATATANESVTAPTTATQRSDAAPAAGSPKDAATLRVYIDYQTHTYYLEGCVRPAHAVSIPRSMAIKQGYELAEGCTAPRDAVTP